MRNIFTEHPRSIGETYHGHAYFAACTGAQMIWAGLACIIHGVLPFVFSNTASQTVNALHESFENRIMSSDKEMH